MQTKENRLKKQAEFSAVMKAGKKFRGKYLLIFSAENKQPGIRTGVVVSKKISKKAVARNRLRRIINHVFDHVRRDKEALKLEVVAIVTSAPEKEVFQKFEEDVKEWQEKL